jgi:hypothetical protein
VHPAIRHLLPACAALALCLSASPALGQVEEGLAAAYPGDDGIASDPSVVFFEDFETGTVGDLSQAWEQVSNAGRMTLPNDAPADSLGSRSLQISAQGGSGGHLYSRLPIGLDTIFVRHYVKYRAGAVFDGHTGVWIGGYNPSTSYPQGGAGIRPPGDERFFLTFQPFGSSRMDFYAYWMGMGGLPDGSAWGNSFIQDSTLQPSYDEWMCIEVMIMSNDPDSMNGELKLWIDGVPILHMGPGFPNGNERFGIFTPDPNGPPWPGFQWRNASDLKANFVWLSMYEPHLSQGATAEILFDQVVVATEYIGPAMPVPEPGASATLLAGSLLLSCLARAKSRRSWSASGFSRQSPSGVWDLPPLGV